MNNIDPILLKPQKWFIFYHVPAGKKELKINMYSYRILNNNFDKFVE